MICRLPCVGSNVLARRPAFERPGRTERRKFTAWTAWLNFVFSALSQRPLLAQTCRISLVQELPDADSQRPGDAIGGDDGGLLGRPLELGDEWTLSGASK